MNALQDCTKTQLTAPVTLVGHGMTGYLFTGGGTSIRAQDKYIAWMPSHQTRYWETPLKTQLSTNTGRSGLVTLLSCHTGAEDQGAKLVCNMANILNRPVRARVGLTFCDKRGGITFEDAESNWQMAEAGCTSLASKPAPRRPLRAIAPKFTIAGRTLDLAEIASVELRSDLSEEADRQWHKLRPADALQMLSFVELDRPQKIDGGPLAVPTGRMRLTIRGTSAAPLELVVWNDRLIEDASAPGTFFYTMDGFSDFFAFNLR